MAKKLLLVAFTTNREVDGATRRVRFPAKSVIDLTKDEMETFDRLTVKTGKLHYRDPIREGGDSTETEPEVVELPDYAGQDVALDKKSVDQLKAFLTFHDVAFDAKDTKADLLKAATDVQTDKAKLPADPDGGL